MIRAVQLFMLIICSSGVFAQNVLQLETRGKISTIKFYDGEELSVKLRTDKFWRNSFIAGIDVTNNIIEFDFGPVELEEIDQIRTPQQRFRGRQWRNKMLMSSAGFILYAPVELIYQDNPNTTLIAAGIGIGVLGFILEPIMNLFSRHRIGGRKRLRLLDLSLPEPTQGIR